MTSKIKIKIGQIEVDYEGSEEFLKEELPELLTAVSNLYKQSGMPLDNGEETGGGEKFTTQGTTGNFAAKLLSKSGHDLVTAAAARLTFAVGKESFSRKEILTEMQSAKAYYKASYSKNLSKYLNSLVKDGVLMEPSIDTYALSAASTKSLRAKLA